MRTTGEQLDAVDLAIERIESENQSVSILGRSFTRANVADLYVERRRLTRQLARETRGGIKTQRGIAL